MTTEVNLDVIYSEDKDLSSYHQENNTEFTSLMHAVIRLRPAENIEWLISDGENVNSRNRYDDNKTALHYAVAHRNCDYDVILTLLRHGADVKACTHGLQMTPIHFAVLNPYMKPEIIKALLSCKGADVNVLGGPDPKLTPLHFALSGSHCKLETVDVLLESKANLSQEAEGLLPIHVALLNSNCSLGIIQLLVKVGIPVSSHCMPPLFMLLCRPDCDSESVELLLENGADPICEIDRHQIKNFSATIQASSFYSIVSFSIEQLIMCFYGDIYHISPLLVALTFPNISPNIVELLLKYVNNPQFTLTNKKVLNYALSFGKLCTRKLKILLKNGAQLCKFWWSSLEDPFHALIGGRPRNLTYEVLKILLENKESRELGTTDAGCTVLHLALRRNYPANCLLLLKKYDIPLDQLGPCQLSSLHHVVTSSTPLWVIESFLEESACVDVRDGEQNTPLHLAGSRPDVVTTLLRYGADATLVNEESLTPLQVFVQWHNWSFEKLQILVKAMVLQEYLAGFFSSFDVYTFVDSILDVTKITQDVSQLKKDMIPFVKDCHSELAYACMDLDIFYFVITRFSQKLHLKKDFIKQKNQTSDEHIYSIKEKMLQHLHNRKFLRMLTSNEFPICFYKEFFLLLLNKEELYNIACGLKIPLKTMDNSLKPKYATPVSILLIAEYLTFGEITNVILAFIN